MRRRFKRYAQKNLPRELTGMGIWQDRASFYRGGKRIKYAIESSIAWKSFLVSPSRGIGDSIREYMDDMSHG